jgi:hypothetical protein
MTDQFKALSLGAQKVEAGLGRVRVALMQIGNAVEGYDLGDGRRAIEEALTEAWDGLGATERGHEVVWRAVHDGVQPEPEVSLDDRVATLKRRWRRTSVTSRCSTGAPATLTATGRSAGTGWGSAPLPCLNVGAVPEHACALGDDRRREVVVPPAVGGDGLAVGQSE